MTYYTYLLRCDDNSLYAGITTNLSRRFSEHAGHGRGAKYTAARRPVGFEAAWASEDRASASRLEYRLKQLTRPEKLALLAGCTPEALELANYRSLQITKTGRILTMLFVCYPKCSTCKKAQAYLDARHADYDLRNIQTENPTEAELRLWHKQSGLPLKRFFNTSGQQYRAMGLSEKLKSMSEDEQFALLATDGMLVKRPILVGDGFVQVGFRETAWDTALEQG